MDDKNTLTRFQFIAIKEISELDPGPAFLPFPGTRWVASSLLQKAIRRNQPDAAIQAGRHLLAEKREHLFRRLNAIAAEDIGIADFQTTAITAACLSSAKVRRSLGGDAVVVDYLIGRMCRARKSRSADDLLMALERWKGLADDRARFAIMDDDRLRQIVLGCPSLDRKALALWFLTGTARCQSAYLPLRKGNPPLALSTLADLGVAPTVLAVAQESFVKTASVLPLFVAILSLEDCVLATGVTDDQTPVETQISGVPSWAYDMYTRPGRSALRRLLTANAGMAEWANAYLPRFQRVQILGELLFRLEGQCLHQRVAGPMSVSLQRRWEEECSGYSPQATAMGKNILNKAMPMLNRIRAELVEEGGE